ncbi:hypothetical protein [Bacteroides sp. 224]|uniref:hypothetical protein n=1 Tax=Bacteroides sp. 224 TaxID=2302936 RepID=UPI0013D874AD|nr:hypothetical protein [Bacteroides sp. 224]NDV63867.1 hypothetical protein [Bacteroides sp. 224]
MTSQALDATTVFESLHPDMVKRTSSTNLIFSGILFLGGIASLFSGIQTSDHTLSLGLSVVGIALVTWAIIRLFIRSKEIVYLPTGSVANKQSIFFDLKYMDELKKVVTTGNSGVDLPLKSDSNGNVRMDVLETRDRRFVAVQLLQFVPYMYSPVTSVYYFTGNEAAAISSFISNCVN